jgi:hypothetical protein
MEPRKLPQTWAMASMVTHSMVAMLLATPSVTGFHAFLVRVRKKMTLLILLLLPVTHTV